MVEKLKSDTKQEKDDAKRNESNGKKSVAPRQLVLEDQEQTPQIEFKEVQIKPVDISIQQLRAKQKQHI